MVLILLLLMNLIGVVVCHAVARRRGSRHVVFWTTLGLLFGPLAIPFVLAMADASAPVDASVHNRIV